MTTPLTVEEWKRQRDIYRLADERDPVSLGFAFFYLNRTNRSGVLHAGVIGGQKQDGNYKIDARFNRDALAARIQAIATTRDRIEVTAQDGRKVIEQWAGDSSAFLYVDPPYVDMGGSLYLNSFTDRDHVELAQTINARADANWVLTYDPVPLVQNLYRGRYSTEYELNYSAYRPGKAKELLVASDPVAQLLRNRT
jgi:DNA adenine methylase